MNPLVILLIGMAIVVGGILWLRLHAFLALILGALTVAALTPRTNVHEHVVRTEAIRVVDVDGAKAVAVVKLAKKQTLMRGVTEVLRADGQGGFEVLGEVAVVVLADADLSPDQAKRQDAESVRFVQLKWAGQTPNIETGDRLLHHTHRLKAKSAAGASWPKRVATGFGNTCMGIGILIAMASIIGKTLMDSGAAERIVYSMRNAFGEKRTPLAFVGSGFTLGIPVFFDTVFYLLIPLGKALRVRTGHNYLLYVLAIVAGGTMAHSLVPPTPGPLFVADELGVDLGVAMLAGCIVGFFTAASGYAFAVWINSRMDVPLRPSAELSAEELEKMAHRDVSELPGLFFSILPILLPVVLLAGGTVFKTFVPNAPDGVKAVVAFLGDKNIALTLAAISGLVLLVSRQGGAQIKEAVGAALAGGGVIILITAAGGSFGHVLRQSGVSGAIQDLVPATQVGLLPLAALICTIVRTAQGSATVAMITTVGIVSPLIAGQDLGYHPVYLMLAIGCGSKPISWMNDSGFWVIGKMSGLTEAEMLKTNTIMGCVMATVGLVICMLGAWLLPLV